MACGASRAEQLRAHREAFTLALELGCTPKEAADILRRRAAQASEAESRRRMAAKDAPSPRLAEPEEPREPWWRRD